LKLFPKNQTLNFKGVCSNLHVLTVVKFLSRFESRFISRYFSPFLYQLQIAALPQVKGE